jgi:hypothetical protein
VGHFKKAANKSDEIFMAGTYALFSEKRCRDRIPSAGLSILFRFHDLAKNSGSDEANWVSPENQISLAKSGFVRVRPDGGKMSLSA